LLEYASQHSARITALALTPTIAEGAIQWSRLFPAYNKSLYRQGLRMQR
jgi:hypothetical protein